MAGTNLSWAGLGLDILGLIPHLLNQELARQWFKPTSRPGSLQYGQENPLNKYPDLWYSMSAEGQDATTQLFQNLPYGNLFAEGLNDMEGARARQRPYYDEAVNMAREGPGAQAAQRALATTDRGVEGFQTAGGKYLRDQLNAPGGPEVIPQSVFDAMVASQYEANNAGAATAKRVAEESAGRTGADPVSALAAIAYQNSLANTAAARDLGIQVPQINKQYGMQMAGASDAADRAAMQQYLGALGLTGELGDASQSQLLQSLAARASLEQPYGIAELANMGLAYDMNQLNTLTGNNAQIGNNMIGIGGGLLQGGTAARIAEMNKPKSSWTSWIAPIASVAAAPFTGGASLAGLGFNALGSLGQPSMGPMSSASAFNNYMNQSFAAGIDPMTAYGGPAMYYSGGGPMFGQYPGYYGGY